MRDPHSGFLVEVASTATSMKLIKQPKSESEFILLILVRVMAAPIDQTREIFSIWHPIHKKALSQ